MGQEQPLYSRRKFIRDLSGQLGVGMLAFSAPSWARPAHDPASEDALQTPARKLGIALVGLGQYSTGQLAPALQETQQCKLVGVVTGTPEKAEKWQKQYNLPPKNIYSYDNLDSIKTNPDIDILYIVLPNALHAEYVIRGAGLGKHIICEKPMAVSVQECEAMIKACKEANRYLSIGYRLHFEPYNQTMAEFGKKKTYGAVRKITAKDGMDIEKGVWRLNRKLAGGGPLMDVGIYCVQGAIYTAGMNPVAVTAKEGPKTDMERFKEVEQSLTWELEFPNGLVAHCETSYAEEMNLLRADAERGWFQLEPAYAYKGLKGESTKGKLDLPHVNQQALQMDDFARCIRTNDKTRVPGEMGLRDVKILMAIYESARTGQRMELKL